MFYYFQNMLLNDFCLDANIGIRDGYGFNLQKKEPFPLIPEMAHKLEKYLSVLLGYHHTFRIQNLTVHHK